MLHAVDQGSGPCNCYTVKPGAFKSKLLIWCQPVLSLLYASCVLFQPPLIITYIQTVGVEPSTERAGQKRLEVKSCPVCTVSGVRQKLTCFHLINFQLCLKKA